MKVILNGKLIDRETAKVDIEDRGYQFGDGIYEGIRVYQRRMFTFDEHMERLYNSARKVDIEIPYSRTELKDLLQSLINENDTDTGLIYFQITRGAQPPRNHVYLPVTEPVISASIQNIPRDPNAFIKGLRAITTEDDRWLNCDIKSLNLLGNVLAKNKAARANAHEAIFHRGDVITECSHSNVFMVKDNVVYTHPADNLILNGITRQQIIKVAANKGISVKEEAFTLSELNAADEIFISSVTAEVTPVIFLNDKPVGNGTRGPLSKKLEEGFAAEVESQLGIKLLDTVIVSPE